MKTSGGSRILAVVSKKDDHNHELLHSSKTSAAFFVVRPGDILQQYAFTGKWAMGANIGAEKIFAITETLSVSIVRVCVDDGTEMVMR